MHSSVPVTAVALITLIILFWRVGIFVTICAALAGSALTIVAGALSVLITGANLFADLASRIGG